MLFAQKAELLAVGVIRERLDDVRSRMDEFTVQLSHELGVLQHHFRHEGAGLEVAAPLELEQIAFGANHRTLGEALEQSPAAGRVDVCHPILLTVSRAAIFHLSPETPQ